MRYWITVGLALLVLYLWFGTFESPYYNLRHVQVNIFGYERVIR